MSIVVSPAAVKVASLKQHINALLQQSGWEEKIHDQAEADRQQPLGLYGALIIEPKAAAVKYDADYTLLLGEWRVTEGKTYPAMELEGMLPNYFTINGKAYPSTETIKVKQGQQVLLRFIGSGQFIHPMHVHGQPFEIIATDGNPVPETARIKKNTVLVGPGERYDVAFTARAPGKWLIHCHINHHIMNDGREEQGGGGLTMILEVTPLSRGWQQLAPSFCAFCV